VVQAELFNVIEQSYVKGVLSNVALYSALAEAGVIKSDELSRREAVGAAGEQHSLVKREIRWYQQTLKQLGLLENTGKRGEWRLTDAGMAKVKRKLTPAAPATVLLGFHTKLGIALWSSCNDVFSRIDEPIALCLTSPPYPLAQPRDYGNVSEPQFVDWLCGLLEPIVKNLMPGGSIMLNVSNDIFMPKSPARSMYRERLVLALHDRLGLHKMDELIWHNPCKAPGPLWWASIQRTQLNVAYESVYWFTNDPLAVRSDNRRVLKPHTPEHLAFVARGGAKSARTNGDGANKVKVGAFAKITEGRIPRNLFTITHNCPDQRAYKGACKALGIPAHGASMPLALASELIQFTTQSDDLVVDPFAGSFTTCKAAELTGRRWLGTELMGEYVVGAQSRFTI
jgi:site-specific DNA-methyltransferase (cytosine-N4-specific)